jgi:hypothetical protein
VDDGAAIDQRAGAALGRQCQLPACAAFGFLVEVEHGHAEVRVVVGVARAAVVQEDEGGITLALVVDPGRVHLARDLQALEALVGEVVLQRFGLDRNAVEFARLLGRHAPLAGGRRRGGAGLLLLQLLFELGDAVAQGAQFLEQFFVALRQRGEGRGQCQHEGGGGVQLHRVSLG